MRMHHYEVILLVCYLSSYCLSFAIAVLLCTFTLPFTLRPSVFTTIDVILLRAVVTGPVYPAMAGPIFPKLKQTPFYKKQVKHKSARFIFGLARLVIC